MNERTIFMAALEKQSSERSAYLDEACGGDDELRRNVEELLHAHEGAGSFLQKPPLDVAPTAAPPDTPAQHAWASSGPEFAFLIPTDKPNVLGMLGEYEVLEVVGRGGMGVVFRAFDPKLDRVVAIKVLAPETAAQPSAVQRFLREARAAAAVNHPNVVHIHRVEDIHKPPYLVMELVAGRSLQEKIDRGGAVELKELLRIGHQSAEGLAASHAQGLVHRDIKPANILLENGVERVKISDFGLARAVDDVRMTKTGTILGTPQYMSPEQANSETVDARSDLFSLGSVLYAMATGRPPFWGESTLELLLQVSEKQTRPIRDINPDMPAWLTKIIDKLMAKDKHDRFQTADEVAELLEAHLAHLQNPDSNPMPLSVRPVRPHRPRQSSSGWSAAAIVIAILLVVAGLPVLVCGLGAFSWLMYADVGGVPQQKRNGQNEPLEQPPEQLKRLALEDQQQLDAMLQNLPKLVSVKSFRLPTEIKGRSIDKGRISPNGRYLAAIDRDLQIFDLQTRKTLFDIPQQCGAAAFSPDSKTVAFFEKPENFQIRDDYLTFLDIETGKKRHVNLPRSKIFTAAGNSLAYSGDGKTIAAGGGYYVNKTRVGCAALFSVESAEFIGKRDVPCQFVNDIACSQNGRRLLTAGQIDGRSKLQNIGISFFEFEKGKKHKTELDRLPIENEEWMGAALTPDGKRAAAIRRVAASESVSLNIWNTANGQLLKKLAGIGTLPTQAGLAVSADGKRLVVPVFRFGQMDIPVALVFNLDTNEPESVLWRDDLAGGSFPAAIGFSGDGETIVTVGLGGDVHYWGSEQTKK